MNTTIKRLLEAADAEDNGRPPYPKSLYRIAAKELSALREENAKLRRVVDAAKKFSGEDDKYTAEPNDCDWDAAWAALKDAIKALEEEK